MKKMIGAMAVAAGLMAISVFPAYAEETALTPGVSVNADENSPTGYTVTFVYENPEAQSVSVAGNFAFYLPGSRVAAIPPEDRRISTGEFEEGMFRANSTDLAIYEEMEKTEDGNFWTVSFALPSGHYTYNYNVDGAEESITDPANPAMVSDAESGSEAKLSTFDVPYDEKQGDTINFDFIMPRDDEQTGTLIFADYEDVNGNQAPLVVYLPYGYDAEREEGYPVLYLSHGGGGNELEWFSSGNSQYLFDNLIAEGSVEPTIVVTMSNGVYDWDYDVINENVMEHIIPFMEENYNVGTEPETRAFAGLSMGGMTTTNIYYRSADQFGYFGIFSGSDSSYDLSQTDMDMLKTPVIMIGAGTYDMAYVNDSYNTDADISTIGIMDRLNELEVDYDFYEVNGGHDWSTWPQLLKIFAENYLWK